MKYGNSGQYKWEISYQFLSRLKSIVLIEVLRFLSENQFFNFKEYVSRVFLHFEFVMNS